MRLPDRSASGTGRDGFAAGEKRTKSPKHISDIAEPPGSTRMDRFSGRCRTAMDSTFAEGDPGIRASGSNRFRRAAA